MEKIRNRCNQNGTSLIEVLVSLVVISTGMLGLLGMQTLTLKQSQQNLAYNQANFLAQDLFARISANADQVLKDESVYELTLKTSQLSSENEYSCSSNICNSTQIADWDMNEWKQNLISSEFLPSGQAEIDITTDIPNQFVSVQLTIKFLYNYEGDSISISNANDAEKLYEQFIFERHI